MTPTIAILVGQELTRLSNARLGASDSDADARPPPQMRPVGFEADPNLVHLAFGDFPAVVPPVNIGTQTAE